MKDKLFALSLILLFIDVTALWIYMETDEKILLTFPAYMGLLGAYLAYFKKGLQKKYRLLVLLLIILGVGVASLIAFLSIIGGLSELFSEHPFLLFEPAWLNWTIFGFNGIFLTAFIVFIVIFTIKELIIRFKHKA